jgi:predicted dehydrogenase
MYMQKMDGMNYAPVATGKVDVVVQEGAFKFAVIGLDHGHVFAMTNGLLEAGATLTSVYDADKGKVEAFLVRYPQAVGVASIESILQDKEVQLVVSAILPYLRCDLGLKVMEAGKDFFADKPGMLTKEDVQRVRLACERTKRKYFIYFGERIHVEGAVYTEKLIQSGALGKVLSVVILAPHRLNAPSRPSWFFNPRENGSILVDIGSHQIEQFLSFAGAESARVVHSCKANYSNSDHPEFCDYGDANLVADNGATCYFRVDWFTPDGLGAWGDGRVFVIGTKGTVEIRKYIDVAQSKAGDHVYFVDKEGEHKIEATGKVGFEFFGKLILDCLDRTELAIQQKHTLLAMDLAIEADEMAEVIATATC